MLTIKIPKTQTGFSFLDFATHVLDNSPAYETRARMRLGYKAVDAIESAMKAESETVSMDDEIGKDFQQAVECAPIPKLFLVINGKPGDAVPKRFFTQFYEAVENGTLS